MAIVISSLTPENPTTIVGGSITFEVIAFDTGGQNLFYQWQFSTDGVIYTPIGLFDNEQSIFTTSNLSLNQNGTYFRVRIENQTGEVVFSNQVPSIGDRIVTVTQAPTISTLAVNYDPAYFVSVGQSVTFSVSASVANVDVSTPSGVANLTIIWQQSTDNGVNWSTLSSGTFGGFTYQIGENVETFSTDPIAYAKNSSLALVNVQFPSNNFRYRPVISYPGATNSPLVLPEILIVVDPQITIIRQPGIGPNDTKVPVQCYKTGIANSGKIYLSVSAITTANRSLSYSWEYNLYSDTGDELGWTSVGEGALFYHFIIKPGTSDSSDVLELERVIYFDKIGFRCIISGEVGENPLTSNEHFILMKDVQIALSNIENPVSSFEDFYGPIPDRNLFTLYSIRNILYQSTLDIARNTGLNGTVIAQYQRKQAGSSTWQNVGGEIRTAPAFNEEYTPFPSNIPNLIDLLYETPPLRFDPDNQSQYRIKITASSFYTLVNNNKVLTEYFSNISTLTVYREAFILNQPVSSFAFINQTAAFSVTAIPSSGTQISYQWQVNTSNISTGWTNITNTSPYSGATTAILSINPVTQNIASLFYRCIVTVPDSIRNYITDVVTVSITRDSIGAITSLNDISVNEFQPVSWAVEAQSFSLGAIQYQWQKSTNFNPNSPSSATWIDIPNQTTDTYSIASVSFVGDTGFYRVRATSQGGETAFSNAAKLTVNQVAIQITQNIPTTLEFLENVENERTLTVSAVSTIGEVVTYRWQIRRVGDASFSDFGIGFNGSLPTSNSYTPRAFTNPAVDNNAIIRCEITSPSMQSPVYSNQCTITVNRRFTYFADTATKLVFAGGNLSLNLFPVVTGGTPSYQWQVSTNNGSTWSNLSGETSPSLLITGVTTSINNYRYRCQVTLANCTQYQYSRNNIVFIVPASTTGFTESVTVSISTVPLEPKYYSRELEKLGAAIGTVVCVPKPPDYINNPSANTDDVSQWKVAVTGGLTTTASTSSVVTSGAIYNRNKPSWANSSYVSPRWLLEDDRFPGFIELRGQWVRKDEFPVLYKVIGDTYGFTSTLFRLPNPYAKKLMGTGNVNNNGGNVSIVPVYDARGISGGDKNDPGTVGGVYNYTKSRQLPPSAAVPDGTAGTEDPATISLGSYRTDNFTECEGVANTNFSGSFDFTIGPLFESVLQTPPPHSHSAISVGAVEGFRARGTNCQGRPDLNPSGPFYAIEPEGGEILDGPEGIADLDRGRSHSHSISDAPQAARNGSANHNTGIGDTPGSVSIRKVVNLNFVPGSSTPSANMFLEPAPIRLTNASRTIFDSSIAFYLKNNEDLPLISNYFRVKYLIKAY
jgi:hypothetical protein